MVPICNSMKLMLSLLLTSKLLQLIHIFVLFYLTFILLLYYYLSDSPQSTSQFILSLFDPQMSVCLQGCALQQPGSSHTAPG